MTCFISNSFLSFCVALGPMAQALVCFLIVHNEIQTKMLGVLRGLGLRESVYWFSWFIPFMISSFLNSVLGAMTAAFMPVHVFQNTYFAGIFGSLFFLQLALTSGSFFLAAVLGTSRRGASWLMLIMLVSPWVPLISNFAMMSHVDANAVINNYVQRTPSGLFWANMNTTKPLYEYDNGTEMYTPCHDPIITETEGKLFKTEQERLEMTEEEWFVGCYASAGLTTSLYSGGGFGTAVLCK